MRVRQVGYHIGMTRAVTVLLLALGFEATVEAYIDPGTGSLALQAIIGAALGAVFYFRRGISKVASLFRRPDDSAKPPE
jgi:hypothetical protein